MRKTERGRERERERREGDRDTERGGERERGVKSLVSSAGLHL